MEKNHCGERFSNPYFTFRNSPKFCQAFPLNWWGSRKEPYHLKGSCVGFTVYDWTQILPANDWKEILFTVKAWEKARFYGFYRKTFTAMDAVTPVYTSKN